MEYKNFRSEIKADEAGTITAFVSVFNNVDLAQEKILAGAFTKSLTKKLPKGVWMHDWTQPIAKTISAEEIPAGDSRLPDDLKELGGLLITGQFNMNTQRGKEAYEDLKFGTVDEFSIGYEVKDSDIKDGVRELKEIELFEWSPVLVGANRATQMTGIKSFDEQFLRVDTLAGDLVNWAQSRIEMRQKAGRTFSATNTAALREYADTIVKHGKSILDLVEKSQPEKSLDVRKAQIKLQLQLLGITK